MNQQQTEKKETLWIDGVEFKHHCEMERMSHESEISFKDRLVKRSNSIKLAYMPDSRVHYIEIFDDNLEIRKGIIYLQKQK